MLIHREIIENHHDKMLSLLENYCRNQRKEQAERFAKLLLLLPAMRLISPRFMDKLFFKKNLTSISAKNICIDLFNTIDSSYI